MLNGVSRRNANNKRLCFSVKVDYQTKRVTIGYLSFLAFIYLEMNAFEVSSGSKLSSHAWVY